MRIDFIEKDGPKNLIGEAELIFGPEDGPLEGLKLVGVSVWRSKEGDGTPFVTMPSRAWNEGAERRFFDLLRSASGEPAPVRKFKSWVSERFIEQRP